MMARAGLLVLCLAAAWSASADLTITKVWPDKVRYVVGEEAVFTITVKNTGNALWSGRLGGEIESGVSDRLPVMEAPLTVAPGAVASVEKRVRIQLGEFGHALHVWAEDGAGKRGAEAREVFCVGPWYYNMGRYITFFNLRDLKTPEAAQTARVDGWRKWYITCAEHFAGPPGAWGDTVPATEEFYTGQAAFAESQTSERALITAAHNNGIAMMQYDVVSIWGPPLEEYSRAHPDWIEYNDRGRPAGFFNMAEMDYFRTMTPANAKPMSPGALNGNVSNLQAQEAALTDLIAGLKRFDFDGVRWDGHTFGKAWDVYGRPTVSGDLDAANARWVVHMKSRLHAALPKVTINYNYYPQSQQEGQELPETYKVMGPNAYLLWESIRGSFNEAKNPLSRWEGYIEGVRNEINKFARPNGNFQHFGWYASDSPIHQNHTQAILYSLGGHWDTWTTLKYDAFSMRFGAYLWDTRFRNLPDASARITVTDPEQHLWWKQFAQERDLGTGRRLLVTHLLNRPVEERQTGFEKQAPAIQRDVKVTLTLQPGEKLARAYLVNPDADRAGWVTPATVTAEGQQAAVTVPSVEFWSFVVWELQR
jgi:hypothetical protein